MEEENLDHLKNLFSQSASKGDKLIKRLADDDKTTAKIRCSTQKSYNRRRNVQQKSPMSSVMRFNEDFSSSLAKDCFKGGRNFNSTS